MTDPKSEFHTTATLTVELRQNGYGVRSVRLSRGGDHEPREVAPVFEGEPIGDALHVLQQWADCPLEDQPGLDLSTLVGETLGDYSVRLGLGVPVTAEMYLRHGGTYQGTGHPLGRIGGGGSLAQQSVATETRHVVCPTCLGAGRTPLGGAADGWTMVCRCCAGSCSVLAFPPKVDPAPSEAYEERTRAWDEDG